MMVDDPYMVRIEALQQLGAVGDAFRELAKAWMPKGEVPHLRDLFAALAMQGMVSGWATAQDAVDIFPCDAAALDSYKIADAMLKARMA